MGILELGSLQLTLLAMMLIGALYTSIFLIPMRIVMWSVGTTYFVAGETVEKKKLIKNVLTHPCLVAIYLGLLCMVTQVQLPSVILNTVKYIGNCNSALTMFIVGTILTDVSLKSIVSRDTVKFGLLRLALLPAAALGVGLLPHLEPTALGVSVLMTGMPAGATAVHGRGNRGLIHRQARGQPVKHRPHGRSMALTKNRHTDGISKGVFHISFPLFL